jgi:tetratricopeptide (TPR) repeat protein
MPQPNAQAQVQARAHFERARQAAEAGDFERAFEAYLQGIRHAPDAVSEGHIELRVLALRRQQQGGAKPEEEEAGQRLSEGHTPLEKMLNAEYLLAEDPENLVYGEAVLRAAVAGGYRDAAGWMADLMFLANNNAKKPSVPLYILLKDSYASIGQADRAAAACQRALRLKPGDEKLEADFKQLKVKLSAGGRRNAHQAPKSAAESGKTKPPMAGAMAGGLNVPDGNQVTEAMRAAAAGAATEQNMAEAKTFFEQARAAAEKKNYDYAIDMYLGGLQRAPEALEEGHLPLCQLGLQRRGKGGKKSSMMERVRRMRGKTPLEQMLNAEFLFAKDPDHLPYAEAMLKAAVEGGYHKTAHWIANLIFQTNNAIERPSLQTYLLLKDSYTALGQYDKAVAACQRACQMKPESKELADEYKNLSAELTMSKGKYDGNGDFRQSIRDRDTQTKLYAQDRIIKTEDYRAKALEDARRAYARDPDQPKHIFVLAETLADLETEQAENEAIQLLEDAYETHNDFNFKEKAGLLKIRQAKRKAREARKQLESRPSDAKARARVEETTAALNAAEIEHYRLCAEHYPTDLGMKYEYAVRLMRGQRYNEAIPLFQEAQKDPRHKVSAMDKVGYCFFMKGWYADAVDIFLRAIESYEINDDAIAKDLRYNLARAYEEQGEKGKALDVYRKIAQLDFGYKDVSERVDRLRAEPKSAGPEAGMPAEA